jgi:hypothetical protein
MWCIGKITVEYRHRMYDLLALYAKAYQAEEPVVCVDEKSKQLLEQTRQPLAGKAGSVAKEDYEYKRAGTRNLFVAVEPKGCHREVEVTARRTKCDFVKFIGRLVETVYAKAQKIHLVLDNLNTHFRGSFVEVLGPKKAQLLLERVEFHYSPKHASWLNMAEIEIGILERQCTDRRMSNEAMLQAQVSAWQKRRNEAGAGIQWKFTRQDADQKLARHYVS